MGTRIDRETFDEADYARFRQRLEHDLSTLGGLLGRPGFGVGPSTLGAELELFLIDGAGRPLPVNQAVCSAAADPRINLELDRFNLELNASPTPLAGRPFAAMGDELHSLLEQVRDAARSEEHTSELQSRRDLVCRLLLEKKKKKLYKPFLQKKKKKTIKKQ